jgi:stringent starvation protein B
MISSRPYLLRALRDWISDNGWTAHLLVDATQPEVVVPSAFIQEGKITLNVGPSAVQGLDMGDTAIRFSARFGGQPMQVHVPIGAVLAIYARENGQGMMFGNEPGADATGGDQGGKGPAAPEAGPGKKPGKRKGPSLKVVK